MYIITRPFHYRLCVRWYFFSLSSCILIIIPMSLSISVYTQHAAAATPSSPSSTSTSLRPNHNIFHIMPLGMRRKANAFNASKFSINTHYTAITVNSSFQQVAAHSFFVAPSFYLVHCCGKKKQWTRCCGVVYNKYDF